MRERKEDIMQELKIMRLREGVYRIINGIEGITLTSQDLRDLHSWLSRHMTRIECEVEASSLELAEEWQEHYKGEKAQEDEPAYLVVKQMKSMEPSDYTKNDEDEQPSHVPDTM
jgi:hypothetical protein